MQRIAVNQRLAAIAGVPLVLPGAVMFAMLYLNIEPPFGPFEQSLGRTNDGSPHVIGSLIAFNAIVVFPLIALILNFAPVMKGIRAGKGFFDRRANLIVAASAVVVVVMFFGAIVVDQYPCWVGVPNCD